MAFRAFESLVGWRYLLRRQRRPRLLIIGLLLVTAGIGLAWWGYTQLQDQGRAVAVFGDEQGVWRGVLSTGGGLAAVGAAMALFGLLNTFLTVFSAFSAFMVTIGVAEVILVLGVMNGFQGDLRRKIIDSQAHVVIEPATQGEYLVEYRALAATVRGVPGVLGATPILRTEVMLSAPTNLAAVALQGIDVATVGEASTLPRQLKHGSLEDLTDPSRLDRRLAPNPRFVPLDSAPAQDAEDVPADDDPMAFPLPRSTRPLVPPSLLAGEELRHNLALWPGETVNAVSPFGDLGPEGPIPKTRPFRLAGWFESGMLEYDSKLAYASLEAVQRFLGVDDVAGAIQVRVVDMERAREVRDALVATLPSTVRITDWQERNSNLFSALKLEKVAMFLVLSINILLAAFAIICTLVMTSLERRREIAILMAMGASARSVLRIFMSQGAFAGLLGAALGTTIGLSGALSLGSLGLPLNPDVYYISAIPVDVRLSDVLAINAVALLVSLLSTIYPALQAARLRPVEGLNAA